MNISILLSAYNGSRFLGQQIESIIAQTNTDWRLYIRDDGSIDNTVAVIDFYTSKYPSRIIKIEDEAGNLKSAASFMHMLCEVSSPYYMFADQDDIWLPGKIETTFNKIREIETQNPGKGVLVFTDLSVVDENLKLIDKSMWNYNHIDPENARNFYKTTCLSSITGCTLMFDNKLKEFLLPYPKTALMHDWWICLNAIHYGIVEYISVPTVLYRQHGNNVLGATAFKKVHYFKKLFSLADTIKGNIRVYKMLGSLKFKVNFLKVILTKIAVLTDRIL